MEKVATAHTVEATPSRIEATTAAAHTVEATHSGIKAAAAHTVGAAEHLK